MRVTQIQDLGMYNDRISRTVKPLCTGHSIRFSIANYPDFAAAHYDVLLVLITTRRVSHIKKKRRWDGVTQA